MGVVVLVATGIALKDQVRQEWYLWELKNGSAAGRTDAARYLQEYPSEEVAVVLTTSAMNDDDQSVRAAADESAWSMREAISGAMLWADSERDKPIREVLLMYLAWRNRIRERKVRWCHGQTGARGVRNSAGIGGTRIFRKGAADG